MRIHYTENEVIGGQTLLGKAMSLLASIAEKQIDNNHEIRLLREQNKHLQSMKDLDESDSEFVEPIKFKVHEGGVSKPTEVDFVNNDHDIPVPDGHADIVENEILAAGYASRGKIVFYDLVEMWMINFNVENTKQPDRAAKCMALTQSFEGRAIIHYMESLRKTYHNGGLTYAVRDTGLVPAEDIRLVTENMTSVLSACRFTQLASYLEHPDPTQLEDFYNV